MKNLLKSSIVTSILLLVLGILLVFESEATIFTISYIVGAILICAGAFALIRFFTKSKNATSIMGLDVLYGIVTIILGCLIIKNPGAIGSLLPIVLGIAIIVSSANKIQYAFNLKNSDNDLWKTTMIISVIGTICGVVLLFNPFAGAVLLMRIVGIFIIVYAILDAVSTFIIKKNVEEFKNVIESQSAKVKEADIVEEKETDEKANKKKNAKNVKKGKRKNNNEEK